MAMKSLKISVEKLLEQEVDEINRAGEEKYIKPFNLSEELTYFAGKIDFYEGIQGHHDTVEDDQTEDGGKADEKKDPKQEEWYWSSVHSKLRIALSEVCVMLDVLQTLNKKRYLILDPIEQAVEPDKQTVQMLQKRKILAKVGNTIAKGASGLGIKTDKPETIVIDEESDYYTQLMELRQFWRIKKSGNQITGDLSYHTSGSKFWHPGLFEVKPYGVDSDDEKTLTINISPDLMKDSEMQVEIRDNNNKFPWKSKTFPIQFEENFVNPWEKNMSRAQHNLFNKEIFSQLSNDAFQGSFLGVDVLNSQIRCKIMQNVEVVISHRVDEKISFEDLYNTETANDLKLLLHSLVYQQHRSSSKFPTPYPSTSNFFGKQSKSSSITNLLHRTHRNQQPPVLGEFLKQAEHKVWVYRVNSFLYQQTQSFSEPSINFHWDVINSRLKSVVKVLLSTKFNCKTIQSKFLLCINKDGFKVFSEDFSSVVLTLDIGSLFRLMQTKIYNHMQVAVKDLSKLHGWSVLNSSFSGKSLLVPTKYIEIPMIITNFNRNKTIFLNIADLHNVKVEITKDFIDKKQLTFLDADFHVLKRPNFTIPWECLPGNYFVEKLEALLLL